jgi:hypothetical protein
MDFAAKLGRVLAIANARPLCPFQFYPLKTAILEHYGSPDGEDVQKIVKICHSCGGSGMYSDHDECRRCFDGIYSMQRFRLRRWKLGTRIFHQPIGIEYDELRPITIQGKIEHRRRSTIHEATAAIGLLFDSSIYLKTLEAAPDKRFGRIVARAFQAFAWMTNGEPLSQWLKRPEVQVIRSRSYKIREADFPF